MTEPTKAPESIYLQYDSDDCTWCVNQVCDDDVKYIRADLVAADRERLKSLDAQPVPVENACVGFVRARAENGNIEDASVAEYIDSLQSALKLAQEELGKISQ